MKLDRRRLRRLIKEEYTRILDEMHMGGGHRVDDYSGAMSHADPKFEGCVQACVGAIPPMMKQICTMGMSHTVLNDIFHICAPIAQAHGCDPDDVHEEVMRRLGA